MLCLVLVVFTLAGRCQGDSDSSSPVVSRRMSAAHLAALRSQLMRDNYDYQYSGERTLPDVRRKTGGTDHLSASELSQSNSQAISSEHNQHEQSDAHDHHGEYDQSGEHELLSQPTQRRQDEPRKQYDQRGQNEQRELDEQQRQTELQRQFDEQQQAPQDTNPEPDLRGNYHESYGQDGDSNVGSDQKKQQLHALERHSQQFSRQEVGSDDQESSRSRKDKKQLHKKYNQFERHSKKQSLATRTSRPRHREVDNSKKDLPYYMADNQLRRRNIANVPDEDKPPEDQPPSPPAPGTPPAHRHTSPEPRTAHARRNFVVTVSAGNVTYKLLMLKSRDGRRRGEQRILEERGPGGVALISLDQQPPPALRLPRDRRQYMHE